MHGDRKVKVSANINYRKFPVKVQTNGVDQLAVRYGDGSLINSIVRTTIFLMKTIVTNTILVHKNFSDNMIQKSH